MTSLGLFQARTDYKMDCKTAWGGHHYVNWLRNGDMDLGNGSGCENVGNDLGRNSENNLTGLGVGGGEGGEGTDIKDGVQIWRMESPFTR